MHSPAGQSSARPRRSFVSPNPSYVYDPFQPHVSSRACLVQAGANYSAKRNAQTGTPLCLAPLSPQEKLLARLFPPERMLVNRNALLVLARRSCEMKTRTSTLRCVGNLTVRRHIGSDAPE